MALWARPARGDNRADAEQRRIIMCGLNQVTSGRLGYSSLVIAIYCD
jgi:hypothetical protein